jgi:hypothetical protein
MPDTKPMLAEFRLRDGRVVRERMHFHADEPRAHYAAQSPGSIIHGRTFSPHSTTEDGVHVYVED